MYFYLTKQRIKGRFANFISEAKSVSKQDVQCHAGDPGFARRRGVSPKGGANLLFWPFSPENCMKLKKNGPRRGHVRCGSRGGGPPGPGPPDPRF